MAKPPPFRVHRISRALHLFPFPSIWIEAGGPRRPIPIKRSSPVTLNSAGARAKVTQLLPFSALLLMQSSQGQDWSVKGPTPTRTTSRRHVTEQQVIVYSPEEITQQHYQWRHLKRSSQAHLRLIESSLAKKECPFFMISTIQNKQHQRVTGLYGISLLIGYLGHLGHVSWSQERSIIDHSVHIAREANHKP